MYRNLISTLPASANKLGLELRLYYIPEQPADAGLSDWEAGVEKAVHRTYAVEAYDAAGARRGGVEIAEDGFCGDVNAFMRALRELASQFETSAVNRVRPMERESVLDENSEEF